MRRVVIALGFVLASWAGRADADPDVEAAKAHYAAGEAAMKTGDFDGAIREYGVTYELSGDPVLWFKLGSANERGGHCDTALIYYQRYAATGPSKEFFALTADRIKACGGEPPIRPKRHVAIAVTKSTPKAPTKVRPTGPHDRAAWILIGTGTALLTVGAIAAYSANASEQDIKDLCAGCGTGLEDPMGTIPEFNAKNKAEYQALLDQGHRYEHLSWVSFGLGAGCGIAAAVLLYTAHHEDDEEDRLSIAPSISPTGAGVQALVHF
ncbi:MAG TPA: hypothetical protein VGM90_21190 [Kofleriaceae bacterium]|jgi:hypothetical protein